MIQFESSSNENSLDYEEPYSNDKILLDHQNTQFFSMDCSPDSKFIACSNNNNIRIYSLEARKQIGQDLIAHTRQITQVKYSPNGLMIASGSFDRSVILWDLINQTHIVLKGHTKLVYSVAFSASGSEIASISLDRTIRIWNHKGNQISVIIYWREPNNLPQQIFIKYSSNYIVLYSYHTIQIFNTKTLKRVSSYLRHKKIFNHFKTPTHQVWISKLLRKVPMQQTDYFSTNHRFVLSNDQKYHYNLYDISTGREIKLLLTEFRVLEATFSCNLQYIIWSEDRCLWMKKLPSMDPL